MPRAPTPARSPPPRPLRRGEMTFRPTHDVGPRTQCISGLNHAAYGLPVKRFAPWVTPGPRITRFRLAADLGRMGLDTHRVSNKVSKITSRHLVPLDRAFPHTRWCMNTRAGKTALPQRSSRPDRKRGRSTKLGHPGSGCCTRSPLRFSGLSDVEREAGRHDGLVPEEGVFYAGLPVVARLLLPLAAPDLLDPQNGVIASARPGSPPRHRGGLRRWHNDRRATHTRGLVDRDRVVGAVGSNACDGAVNRFDQRETGLRVVGTPVGQRVRDDRSRSIDAQMKCFSSPAGPRPPDATDAWRPARRWCRIARTRRGSWSPISWPGRRSWPTISG